MEMKIERVNIPLHTSFVITGYTFTALQAVWVTLFDGVVSGRGEGVGIYYLGESQDSMVAELEAIQPKVEAGATRQEINNLMPRGGARNALDCAFWDLECKQSGKSIWELTGITPAPLFTVATIGIGTLEQMANRATELASFQNIKIKVSGESPVEAVAAVREARPDATLVVDANQGWSLDQLKDFAPKMEALGVRMIEQPLARGLDHELANFASVVPLGADESALDLAEYKENSTNYQVVNIKLDKCGGLTEALQIVAAAKKDGKTIMVGNMTGTSLSMAPAFVIGQECGFVDIDGPLLLGSDIEDGLEYLDGGKVMPPSSLLWG